MSAHTYVKSLQATPLHWPAVMPRICVISHALLTRLCSFAVRKNRQASACCSAGLCSFSRTPEPKPVLLVKHQHLLLYMLVTGTCTSVETAALTAVHAGHRNLCSSEMHTGLYLVIATGLKRRLEEAADTTANKLLDQIQTMARDSNDHICQTYTRMAAGVGLVCNPHCQCESAHMLCMLEGFAKSRRTHRQHEAI